MNEDERQRRCEGKNTPGHHTNETDDATTIQVEDTNDLSCVVPKRPVSTSMLVTNLDHLAAQLSKSGAAWRTRAQRKGGGGGVLQSRLQMCITCHSTLKLQVAS